MESTLSLLVTGDGEDVDPRTATSYDADIHAWAMEQAEFIRLRRFSELDLENLADEVEDMARRVRKELVSRLSLVYTHLLKWDRQPERRSASWARTIREQRRQVGELLVEAPTLGSRLPVLSEEAFKQGRVAALNETGLSDAAIPERNPYTWVDLMTRSVIWPEP